MRRAYCLIRPQPVYRREAFMAGLQVAGYEVRGGAPHGIEAGDVVLMWNRYGENHELACRVEKQGGVVLVAENGYVARGGLSPHSMAERDTYALAIGGHNGSGTWPSGGPERWGALGVALKPWRAEGQHILVCPNRSFGRPDLIMPVRWAAHVCTRLAAVTKREVRLRPHPGNSPPKVPLARDLEDCWAVVIWSSSAGVHALIAGVPVISEAPAWICKLVSNCFRIDSRLDGIYPSPVAEQARSQALHRLAWAQWHVDELAGGEPFRRLLDGRAAKGRAEGVAARV